MPESRHGRGRYVDVDVTRSRPGTLQVHTLWERLWDAPRGCAHFESAFVTPIGGRVEHPWDAAIAFDDSRGCSVASTACGQAITGGIEGGIVG